jgi:hypothetical protein
MEINLSDEILVEIGKITVVFGLIEDSLNEIIGRIITVGGRIRELGTIVTAELSFKNKISVLTSLLHLALEKDNEALKQFDRIKPLLFDAEQKRNVVVHSVWAKDEESPDVHGVLRIKSTAKSRHGLRTDFISMNLDDLRQTTDRLGEAYGQLCVFELQFHSGSSKDHSDGAAA